jgi:2-enoate reductase
LVKYQINQLKKVRGLKIKINTEVTKEIIEAEKPEIIFIATGSVPLQKADIENLDNIPFSTPMEIFEGKSLEGSKAFIVGGGAVGCETAIYLAKKNYSVVLTEILPEVASGLFEANRKMLLELLKEYGVEVLTQTTIKKLRMKKVIASTQGRDRSFDFDLLVLAVGRRPVNNLVKIAEEIVEEVRVVGDCASPRKIKDAIWESFKWARIA